jgi:hypothetical protein
MDGTGIWSSGSDKGPHLKTIDATKQMSASSVLGVLNS